MEKDAQNSESLIQGIGSVRIADDAVAVIVSLAATEVEGVSLAGNMTRDIMNKMVRKNMKGVKVDVKDGVVSADLMITVEYGCNIPVVCQNVQSRVRSAVENMTGLTCGEINIRISGVDCVNR